MKKWLRYKIMRAAMRAGRRFLYLSIDLRNYQLLRQAATWVMYDFIGLSVTFTDYEDAKYWDNFDRMDANALGDSWKDLYLSEPLPPPVDVDQQARERTFARYSGTVKRTRR